MINWIDSMFQRETIPVLESALGFANAKQLAIMNNIANINNPYYKRQDLPEGQFMRVLGEAIDERREDHWNSFEPRETLDVRFADRNYPVVRMRDGADAGPERHDENTVVPEKEMADLAKNTMMIQTMQLLFKKKLGMMRSSLRDRVI